MKNAGVLFAAALVIALPFLFRVEPEEEQWSPGDPVLIMISPHNEAIRFEFARAFNRWHLEHHGSPVKIDWRVIGGTSEIGRYLEGETQASFRGWWTGPQGNPWPRGGTFALTDHRFGGDDPDLIEIRTALRATDDATAFGTGLDLFFGGGEYDHAQAFAKGLTVPPWSDGIPDTLTQTASGLEILPARLSGETWRAEGFVGTALSTFGIVYNKDRLADLGIETPPTTWRDLTDFRFHRQLGVADPTKSGSVAKAFEMIIHQEINQAVTAAGFSHHTATLPEAPPAYHDAVARGWLTGINLVRLIGANARYFTDSAGKVPIDVSTGNAAVGLAIDFYGRYQAETSRNPDTGRERMRYVTPVGGSSVSCDPISLLRGAPNRDIAVRFIEFTLSEAGQNLWNYRPDTPGGPEKFALRRLPIRRDYYPSDEHPELQARFEHHAPFTSDDLSDPTVNPYYLASQFEYVRAWTGGHFSIHRNLIRAMCLDAGDELSAAWAAIGRAGGPEAVPEAMEALFALPEGVTWSGVLDRERFSSANRMDYMREWVLFFRQQYREARRLAEQNAERHAEGGPRA